VKEPRLSRIPRDGCKNRVTQTMDERNKYREMIDDRKIKESDMLGLIQQDKDDIPTLKTTIEEAQKL
jgi:hypothetical protein